MTGTKNRRRHIWTKRFIALAVGAFILISALLIYMGYTANKEIEKTVSDQFNQQQLILARHVAGNILNHFEFLRTHILQSNQSIEKSSLKPDLVRSELAAYHPLLKGWSVLALGYKNREERAVVVPENTPFPEDKLEIDDSVWEWAKEPKHHGRVLIGHTFVPPSSAAFHNHRVMIMATPVFKADDRTGKARHHFQGLTFAIVDASDIAQKYAKKVRSGKTGYAWVIDQDATFLSHYEQSFIGQDFFKVRQRRNPQISYSRINEITRKSLLKGAEGTDWYVSGWHRGETGEIKKLFAYSPVLFNRESGPGHLWSVGVTAPVGEICGTTQSLILRQWINVAAFQFVVFSCLVVVIYVSLRWSTILKDEVDKRTADLRRSEQEVRTERDRVKESMEKLIEMQEALIRSERFAAIGEAAAHVSHEIKNPLMIIGGFAVQIEKSLSPDDPNAKKLQIISNEVRRLEDLLTEVKDFTRPTKPQKESGDINYCVGETLEMMLSHFEEKGVTCEKSLNRSLPAVSFDSSQMKQVLINLIKNAVEAMPHGGKLIVSSLQSGPYIKVSIADSGYGIPEDSFKNVFSPFFTTKNKGTGLGLTVSYRILQDHGGTISFESKTGEGTKFTLSLPIEAE
ncbi:MAG: ATP-binding protein [Pseudomonadota bacterium]